MTSLAPAVRRPRAPRLALLLALLVAGGSLHAAGWGRWDQYPDMSHAPDPSSWSGWDEERLAAVWSHLRRFGVDEGGAHARTDATELGLQPGEKLGVFYRMQGRQGLAGNAEVLSVDGDGEALLRIRLAHLMLAWDLDPWKGWTRGGTWRPGYGPSRMRYFVSRRNLSGRPEEEWEAICEARVERGMWGPDVLRAWGAPSARGAYDYATGRQEQWTYEPAVNVRYYVYVDVATRRVTGLHGGRVR